MLKSKIGIAPDYPCLHERIRAHAFICFMALIFCRLMRKRLVSAGHIASPESAMALL